MSARSLFDMAEKEFQSFRDYAAAMREYVKISSRSMREVQLASALAIHVEAARKARLRKSLRPTTNLLKRATRVFWTSPRDKGEKLAIQKIIGADERVKKEVFKKRLRSMKKAQVRAMVSAWKVKPVANRLFYYVAGFLQIAEQIARHQMSVTRFKYKGKIKAKLGQTKIQKGRGWIDITSFHKGRWARRSAEVAILDAIRSETRQKMKRIARAQEKGWMKSTQGRWRPRKLLPSEIGLKPPKVE